MRGLLVMLAEDDEGISGAVAALVGDALQGERREEG